MLKRIFGDMNFFKTLTKIAIPISLQSLVASSLGVVDQMMIGHFGEKTVAGVGIGGRIPFIFFMVIVGITSATSIYTAQYYGKKDLDQIKKVLGTTFCLGLPITIIFTIVSLILPSQLAGFFTEDTVVIEKSGVYLSYVAIGYFPLLVTQSYNAILRSTHHVKLPMIAGMISFVLNTLLNYIFIFGHFGVPELGIKGAALATAISRVIEMIIIVSVVYIKRYPGAVSIVQMFHMNRTFAMAFIITGLPLLFNEFLWALSESIYVGIYGHMGTNQTAAMTMTFPLQSLAIAFFTGVSSAAGIMLGNLMGDKKEEDAYNLSKHFIAIGIIGALIIGAIMIVFSNLYGSVFEIEDQTMTYFKGLITVFAGLLFVKVSNMIIGGGILRSGGQTKLTLYLDLMGGWLIGIPLGLLTSRVLGFPIYLVYLFISMEEVFRLIIGIIWLRKKNWIKNLT